MAIEIQELFGEKKLQDYYFARLNHRKNTLENENKILETKVQQVSEINNVQEKLFFKQTSMPKIWKK